MSSEPTITRGRWHSAARLLGAVALTGVLVLLLMRGTELAALQKMAGYDTSSTMFGKVKDYLNNLRDSLIPLAVPLGAIGLTGGGVAYMVGNPMAQRMLGGVVIGLALVLLGPSLVA